LHYQEKDQAFFTQAYCRYSPPPLKVILRLF
jgi:hypothetical protein